MLELIESIKAQAERDLLYAEAKIDVCNSLIANAKENERERAVETATDTDCEILGDNSDEYSAMPMANL